MAYTLANTITYTKAFIGTLDPTVYTGSEPAISSANQIGSLIVNAPFTWPWNRTTTTQAITNAGGQDYTISAANFGFLEKCTITDGNGKIKELDTVYNTLPLALNAVASRPEMVAVQTTVPGTSFSVRFNSKPDANYTATFIYQKAPVTFTATSNDWFSTIGIPYSFIDVFNPLFLSEMLQFSDDSRAQLYRQRGMAALLSKAEGLTQMQRNTILAQWMQDDLQTLAAQIRTQQAQQARSI